MAGSIMVSGLEGIDKKITSVNIISTPDIERFVKAGDLIITALHPIKDKLRQAELIPNLIKKGALALAISPESDNQIPQELITAAQTLSYPIIQLPADISFFEILSPVLEKIRQRKDSETKRSSEARIIKEILNKKIVSGSQLQDITEHYSIKLPENFIAALIKLPKIEGHAYNLETDKIYTLAENLGLKEIIITELSELLLIIVPSLNQERQQANLYKTLRQYREICPFSKIALSNVMPDILGIHKAVQQAKQTLAVAEKLPNFGPIVNFNELGLYQVLSIVSTEDVYLKSQFTQEKLGSIKNYDELNKTEIYLTLKTFFAEEESIKQTAAKLRVHPNTIINRLRITKEVIGIDLANYKTKLELNIALKLNDLL